MTVMRHHMMSLYKLLPQAYLKATDLPHTVPLFTSPHACDCQSPAAFSQTLQQCPSHCRVGI